MSPVPLLNSGAFIDPDRNGYGAEYPENQQEEDNTKNVNFEQGVVIATEPISMLRPGESSVETTTWAVMRSDPDEMLKRPSWLPEDWKIDLRVRCSGATTGLIDRDKEPKFQFLLDYEKKLFYYGQPLFTHAEMLKEKRLYLFPTIHSLKLLKNWQEPCIVFRPHWSLRFGPVTHLLRRWCGDPNSLLVIEKEVDAGLALLPFKPMEIDMKMKVLQCPFLSGIPLQKSHQLLKWLLPKHVVFPKIFGKHNNNNNGHSETSFSFSYYKENEKLNIPYTKKGLGIRHCRRTGQSAPIGNTDKMRNDYYQIERRAYVGARKAQVNTWERR